MSYSGKGRVIVEFCLDLYGTENGVDFNCPQSSGHAEGDQQVWS